MNDRSVIIITGEEISSLSNQIFKLKVRPRYDHSCVLSEFINEHKIKYPYIDYAFAHNLVRMAVLSNIVIFSGKNFRLISLPDKITDFQLQQLEENNQLTTTANEILCIMSITREDDKLNSEEYNSSVAPKVYNSLIEEKHNKWKNEQISKTKQKNYPN